MFIILSAKYIQEELRSEFGKIPPAFLPIGNKRLFEHQFKLIPYGEKAYITVPHDFKVNNCDKRKCVESNVEIISCPEGLNLGESLVAAVSIIESELNEPLKILFGDTLFREIPKEVNLIASAEFEAGYNWSAFYKGGVRDITEHEMLSYDGDVFCGYLSIANPRRFIKILVEERWCFLSALSRYSVECSAENVIVKDWYDFGHVNTYYKSKALFTTQRSFNELIIDGNTVRKSSKNRKKIKAEASWYKEIPAKLKHYTPQFFEETEDGGGSGYSIEFLRNTSLSEMYVFAELPIKTWHIIFSSVFNFLDDCKLYIPSSKDVFDDVNEIFSRKTQERLKESRYFNDRLIGDSFSFNGLASVTVSDVIEEADRHISELQSCCCLIHGDFCFSNILYDFRAGKVRVIDPRGITNKKTQSIYGSQIYDIAKLSHSVLGLYDFIVCGYYQCEVRGSAVTLNIDISEQVVDVQKYFISEICQRYKLEGSVLYAVQVHLFLSMIPLHADSKSRQDAMFANALRCYHKMVEKK